MLGSVRELAKTLLAFAETRARLAAADVEEQTVRVVEIALWAALTLFFFAVSLVFLSVFILLLFWDSHRELTAALIGGLWFATAVLAGLTLRSRLRARPTFFAATLEELRKDRQQMEAKP